MTRGDRPWHQQAWFRIFWIGLVLWLAAVGVTYWTANANLIPTIVLLGSFLVPVTFASWSFEHSRRENHLTIERILAAFLVGGVMGVLGASVLESYLVHPSTWMYLVVGLIEEGVKLAAVWLMARRLAAHSTLDGIVLGAAVGFGFAAFESSGYALTALITVHGLSLRDLVSTEILRGLLAPLGHGLWTAILGGALFRTARRTGHLRLTGALFASYLGVSVLHALWDSMHGIALALTLVTTGAQWQWRLIDLGYDPRLTNQQAVLLTVYQWIGLLAISLIGLGWLRRERARGRREEAVTGTASPTILGAPPME
ncbi:hypothetical protein BIV57_17830 [Mangrovactinospora gilvigrisea]|uniref:PrsW family intramembrane metalloprotease n=1 Tax=Mangrovactinospora gilvigrisea TaxID=1428644 RepID=A0A1J7BBX2_9ACTN|nr:hypothetical protein BIV57_17830 [Mangrovactinospora gilvigrisea]